MKNFAALLATVASVNAVQLGAEAEAQFGIESFFSSGDMIPQFLGSGMFPTEDVPTNIHDVIDSEDEVKIVDEADADEDDDEDEDEYDDFVDFEAIEAADESPKETDDRDAHAGVNAAFANLANFDFDAAESGDELPIDLDVPLVPNFEDSGDVPSLVSDIGGVTESIKLALISEIKEAKSKEEAEEGDEDEASDDEGSDEGSDDDSEDDTPSYLIRCTDSDCELDE